MATTKTLCDCVQWVWKVNLSCTTTILSINLEHQYTASAMYNRVPQYTSTAGQGSMILESGLG